MSFGISAQDQARASLISDFRELDQTEATCNYWKAIRLADLYLLLLDQLGEGEGEAEYHRIRKEELGLGDTEYTDPETGERRVKHRAGIASKLLKAGLVLRDAPTSVHVLPREYLYYLARAIEAAPEARDDLYAEACSMPQKDFCESHGLIKPRSAPEGVCPKCAHEDELSAFRKEQPC